MEGKEWQIMQIKKTIVTTINHDIIQLFNTMLGHDGQFNYQLNTP